MAKPWQEQEKRIAKKVGAVVNRGSGSGWLHRQDIRDTENGVLWECKMTGAKSITIKAEDWDQLRRHAIMTGVQPVMHAQLGQGSRVRRLVVLDEDDFLQMLEECRRGQDD